MTTQTPAAARTARARARLSPRRRRLLVRVVQYVVLVGALVALASLVKWDSVQENIFNVEAAKALLPKIPRAFGNTLLYMVCSFALSIVLGTLLALMRVSEVRLYRIVSTIYVEFFRGIPALLYVIAVGLALPLVLSVSLKSTLLKVTIALGMVSAAYVAETMRAGLQAVPKGQVEAARSLGMSQARTTVTVVVPQAFRIVLPPLTNEIILLTKDTALISSLGLMIPEFELTKIGQNALASGAGGGLTPLFVVGACYLVITIPLGIFARRLEAKGARSRS
ncbi:amino acid ABC transporter permease [Sanguibacter sp. HDW7]|uniref:amino acid ABC transporter permease n=1 Tax=Sanguibacter sp. HDW7 TaxID=2714931 RepID=UPI00140A4B26|nr:amino acid ABC transporter permease [Sanguibacter sp. HDW7]QIK83193.1 amino acid ABC transporter permease [Sanguibacter sp. HDW7]